MEAHRIHHQRDILIFFSLMFSVRFAARPRSFLRLSFFGADVSGPIFPRFPRCVFDQLCKATRQAIVLLFFLLPSLPSLSLGKPIPVLAPSQRLAHEADIPPKFPWRLAGLQQSQGSEWP